MWIMSNTAPTVSVVMCTYNGEKFVSEQLDSILAQTCHIDEIIVQDDCSTDNTVDIVRRYAQRHSIVKLFVNERNLGFNDNFHHALSRATCDYVAISDQDDIWYAQKLERQMQAIGDKDMCATAYDIGASRDSAHYLAPSSNIERYVFGGGVAGHTMLISRDFLVNRNQWIEGITYDWSLLMNAYFGKGVVILPEALNWHRRHDRALGNVYQSRPTGRLMANVKPYVYGWSHYRKLQKKQNWKAMYAFIERHTDHNHDPLAHRLATLLLQSGTGPLLKLCLTCLKHRRLVYPDPLKTTGLAGRLRAFVYPAIYAYGNYHFDWAD